MVVSDFHSDDTYDIGDDTRSRHSLFHIGILPYLDLVLGIVFRIWWFAAYSYDIFLGRFPDYYVLLDRFHIDSLPCRRTGRMNMDKTITIGILLQIMVSSYDGLSSLPNP